MQPSIDYTHFDMHDGINRILEQIKYDNAKFDMIVGLSRGGLVPGIVLSHKLGVPFWAVNWSKNLQEVNSWVWESLVAGKRRILIVDDMVDTGDLLKQFFEHVESWAETDDNVLNLEKVSLAVLINNTDVKSVYTNSTGSVVADYYGKEISRIVTPNWITYWWEK